MLSGSELRRRANALAGNVTASPEGRDELVERALVGLVAARGLSWSMGDQEGGDLLHRVISVLTRADGEWPGSDMS